MAQINIRDVTRDRINVLVELETKPTPYTKITQDYIITKALKLLEVKI
jgi:hypothetical protein